MQSARTWSIASTKQLPYPSLAKQQWPAYVRCHSSIPKQSKQRNEDGVLGPAFKKLNLHKPDIRDRKKRKNAADAVRTQLQSTHNDRDIINPLSLEDTLRAHQQANEESVIIRHTKTISPADAPTISLGKEEGPESVALHLELERDDAPEGKGQWEDYKGKPRALLLDWEIIGDISRNLKTPWMRDLSGEHKIREFAAPRLSAEIRAADLFFSPSPSEWEATNQAIKHLESFVRQCSETPARLDVIGSRASGLATPLSDLDLNLVIEGIPENPGANTQLLVLAKLFKLMKWGNDKDGKQANKGSEANFRTAFFAARARVPIIVGVHASGLEFQIQCASSSYGSLELVKGFCAEYPTLRALFKIIKQALKMRGLTDGAQGGLTSYPLINMITVTLKKYANYTDPFDAGEHLLQFLEYWSTIDLYKTGVTHVPSRFLSNAEEKFFADQESALKTIALVTQDPVGAKPLEFDVRKKLVEIHEGQDSFMMTLHDPANPYNDLGRSAYAMKHIQATFMDMHSRLKKDISEWDSRIRAQGDAGENPPSLLKSLIEGDYTLYNMERRRLTAERHTGHNEATFEIADHLT